MHKTLLCAVAVSGLIQGCSTLGSNGAAKQQYTDYVNDANASRILTSSGDCLRSINWSTDAVVVECQASAKAEPMEKMAMPAKQMALSYDSTALFDFDSSELSSVGVRELDGLIGKVGSSVKVDSIKVVGHADSIGPADYNQGLSEQRAATVQRYLQNALGEDISVIMSGMGESAPVSDNTSEAGRMRNRRVEVTINSDVEGDMFN